MSKAPLQRIKKRERPEPWLSPKEVVRFKSEDIKAYLSNWNALSSILRALSIEQINVALRLEIAGRNREAILLRLHTRKVALIKAALWEALLKGEVRDAA